MHTFTVWAPAAKKVDVVLGDEPVPMTPYGRGWWAATVAGARAGAEDGTDYAFSLDGGPARPDPRSQFQPAGIGGPSRLVDHGAFAWTDASWRGLSLAGAVVYELHVGTFSRSGTFEGAIAHLDHLVELGVDAVELLPVAEFSGDHGWGYDGVDLFAPHHAYGGPKGLKSFVDACHARGLGVVMDVVYNHLGPAGGYLGGFGPYFTSRHTTTWGPAVNFDGPGSDEVRGFVLDNARMWLEDYHCDGLRLDAVHAIADDSAVHILEELTTAVRELAAHLRKPLFVVAESDRNDPRVVRPAAAGGSGCDAAWADDFHHALQAALTGERSGYYVDFGPLALVTKALRQAWVYDGTYSAFRQRRHGRPPLGLRGEQFVVYLQNHDQVGNRAGGERITTLTSPGRAKIGAALVLFSPFVPLLFQGEEWGATSPFLYFTDHRDAALGRAVSEGRRAEFASFGWSASEVPDPQDRASFESSKLNWSELESGVHAELVAWYKTLLSLRRQEAALAAGSLEAVRATCDEATGWLVVTRADLALMANLGTGTLDLPLPGGAVRAEVLAASGPGVGAGPGGAAERSDASGPGVAPCPGTVRLPPDSVAVVRLAVALARQGVADEERHD